MAYLWADAMKWWLRAHLYMRCAVSRKVKMLGRVEKLITLKRWFECEYKKSIVHIFFNNVIMLYACSKYMF